MKESMKVVFELSGEHPSLPPSEILHCLRSEGIENTYLDVFGSFLLTDIKNERGLEQISKRLSLTHFINMYLFSANPSLNDLLDRARDIDVCIEGSFRIRCENRSNQRLKSTHLERKLGEIYAVNYKVDLENPDTEIRLLLSDEVWFVGKRLFQIDRKQYEKRKANYRPFFLPISMHPRLARCMVNLSEVKAGEKLLDPFCGTGGMLIEAGLIGAKVAGSDIKGWIVNGCKQNLEHYGIREYELENIDVGEIGIFGKVDAVVTDFPYGRASTTNREPVEKLYRRAFSSISDVLRSGKRLVCAVPSVDLAKIGCEYMNLVEIHPLRVHGNLTRYICIFTK